MPRLRMASPGRDSSGSGVAGRGGGVGPGAHGDGASGGGVWEVVSHWSEENGVARELTSLRALAAGDQASAVGEVTSGGLATADLANCVMSRRMQKALLQSSAWTTAWETGVSELGNGLNTRRMSVDGLVPAIRLPYFAGVVRRMYCFYSHLLPAHAEALQQVLEMVIGQAVPWVVLRDVLWQDLGKRLTTHAKVVSGEWHTVGGWEFSLDEMDGFTDLNRFVGYNAKMPPTEEAVKWAKTWLCADFKVSDRLESGVPESTLRFLRSGGGAEWVPTRHPGLTWANLDDYAVELLLGGAGDPGPRMYYIDEAKGGEHVKVDKTKSATFGATTLEQLQARLRSFLKRPADKIVVFVKPDELGKLRHLAKTSETAFMAQELWVKVVMHVLRGHLGSPLFHSMRDDIRYMFARTRLWREHGYVALPLDESKFDEHKSAGEVLGCIGAIGQFTAEYVDEPALFNELTRAIQTSISRSRVQVDGVDVGMWRSGVASGWAMTALIDTVLNAAQQDLLAGGTSVAFIGMGDDADVLKASLAAAKAEVAAYNAAGLEVNEQKQSYGTRDRPKTEFLRRVTTLRGGCYTQQDVPAPLAGLPALPRVVVCVCPRHLHLVDGASYIAKCWPTPGMVAGDANVWVVPGLDEVVCLASRTQLDILAGGARRRAKGRGAEQAVSAEGGYVTVELPGVGPWRQPVMRVTLAHLSFSRWAWSGAQVYGYATRMLPGFLLRKPGSADPADWEVRAESAAASWMKLIARGAEPFAACELMVADIHGSTHRMGSFAEIGDWLSTPACFGGVGLQPFAMRYIELVRPAIKSRYRFGGYRGLFDQAAMRAGLPREVGAQLVTSRLRGYPVDVTENAWHMISGRRTREVFAGAVDLGGADLAQNRVLAASAFPTGMRWRQLPPTQEGLRSAWVDGLRIDDVIGEARAFTPEFAKRLAQWADDGEIRLAQIARAKMGGGLLLSWFKGDVGVFKAPRVPGVAERWVAEVHGALSERAMAKVMLKHRVTREDLEKAALWLEIHLQAMLLAAAEEETLLLRD